jgi:cytochrome c
MRSGQGKSLTAPLLIGLAAVAFLLPRREPRERGIASPGPGLADLPSGQRPRADEGTATPAAARMLLHLLGWGTGGAAIIAAVWISATVWMAERQTDAVARALTGGNPANASTLATRYGCGGCHTIPGVPGAVGQVGPPLEGLRSRVFIAGVLPNTADNLVNWIVQPHRWSPRSAMPETGIGADGARDIAAYLYTH